MDDMSKEEVEALKQKLKDMSPEELKEFQKSQCVFCNIISGKVASKKIYEDDKCIGLLDINPANPGHVLLLPKEHYAIMPMIPEDEIKHIAMVAKKLSHIILKELKVEGTTIFVANGGPAGQRAQHFMMHIIPRKEGDSLPLDIPNNGQVDEEAYSLIAAKVNERLKPKKKVDVALSKKQELGKVEEPQTLDAVFSEEPKKKKAKKKSKKKVKKKKVVKKEPVEEKEESADLDDIAALFS